jgi:hypothetical protein
MEGKIFLESKGPGNGATAIFELQRRPARQKDDFNIQDYFIG